MLQVNGGGWEVARLVARRHAAARVEYISINESTLWLVDVASGQKTPLTNPAERGLVRRAACSRADGRGVYVTTDKDSEFQRLGYIDLATQAADAAHDRLQLGRRGLRPLARRQDARLRRQRGRRLAAAPVRHGDAQARGRSPACPVGVHRRAGAGTRTAATSASRSSSARSTADVYSLDAANGKVDALDRERARRPRSRRSFAEPELIRWKSFDGREISGFLYPPAGDVHRQAPGASSTSTAAPRASRARASSAAATTSSTSSASRSSIPNVRGSTGYGKTFLDARQRHEARGLGEGHRRAARLDRARSPDLDADRVMVTGGSYGGYMTLAVVDALQRPHPLRARRRRHLQLRHLPREHRELPPRPAPRRIRRRARPEDARVPRADRAAEQRAARSPSRCSSCRAGTTRACRCTEAEQMVATREEERHAGLVPDGQGRRPRLREEAERRLPVLRDGDVRAPLPARSTGVVLESALITFAGSVSLS